MTYLYVTIALIFAMLALVLWGLALPLLGLLKIINGASAGLVLMARRLLKWI
ncbi:MAG: hypothetical protein KGL35_04300 [Bradyrhizobium sp.]|nr:hypothetical protein [Bradyrhizobium sp.]